MRSIRKLTLLGFAALMICAAVASMAQGAAVRKVSDNSLYTGAITGTSTTDVTLDTNWVGTVTCTSSMIDGSVTGNNPVAGSITGATWTGGGTGTNCTSNIGDCTTAAVNLNWSATAAWLSDATNVKNGTMTVSKSGSYVGATVTCGGNPCTFGATSVTLDLYNGGNTAAPHPSTHATAVANVGLSLKAGNPLVCGTAATWHAVYDITGTGGVDLKIASS